MLNDLLAEIETQSGTSRVTTSGGTSVEALEEISPVFIGNSGSGVSHRKANFFVTGGKANRDHSTTRSKLERIVQQVSVLRRI